jgi:hypothetical protein
LVYPIVKSIEAKNRRFTSAYFGWIRFRLEGAQLETLQEELRSESNILRFLIVKVTKEAEAHPFRFHEHRKSIKMVETVDEEAAVVAPKELTEAEENVPVVEEVLNESLDKITHEGENSGKEDEVKVA